MTTRPLTSAGGIARPPRILDVVDAVKRLARAHPEIGAWWYAPVLRRKGAGNGASHIEVVAEAAAGASPEYECLGRELGAHLGAQAVVRAHRGESEAMPLLRLARAPQRGVDGGHE
jgi:hypothetical protein